MNDQHLNGFNSEVYVRNILEGKGYSTIISNYVAYGYGEIDLVMKFNEQLYFIEVRSVRYKNMENPVFSINNLKLSRLRRAASKFLYDNPGYSIYPKKFTIASLQHTQSKVSIKFYEL